MHCAQLVCVHLVCEWPHMSGRLLHQGSRMPDWTWMVIRIHHQSSEYTIPYLEVYSMLQDICVASQKECLVHGHCSQCHAWFKTCSELHTTTIGTGLWLRENGALPIGHLIWHAVSLSCESLFWLWRSFRSRTSSSIIEKMFFARNSVAPLAESNQVVVPIIARIIKHDWNAHLFHSLVTYWGMSFQWSETEFRVYHYYAR